MPKALFLDRDGVINHEAGYLSRAEDIRFVDGIFSLCRTARSLGYHLFVITNQAGIGRGFYSDAEFHTLMGWMRAQFIAEGAPLDEVYYCPYHPEHGLGEYKREHEDRKPSPGMLHRAARTFDVDLSQCILIGDRCTDLGAAHAAGLRQAFLITGTEPDPCPHPHILIESLTEAEAWLQQHG